MAEPSDLNKYKRIVVWALYLPYETHAFLRIMGIAFGGNPKVEQIRQRALCLIAELLFPESIDCETELGLIAFFLMLSESVFR
jgi:hypothetical protein